MAETAENKTRLVAEQFGKIAAVYDDSPFFPICGRRLVDLAEIRPGDQVLDVACGTGAVLFAAAERAGKDGHVIGIDITGPMVDQTNRKIRERRVTNAEARQANAEHLEFADSTFDVVFCGFALWFIPDLNSALNEIHRALRPGGRFAASTWGPPGELTAKYQEMFRASGGFAPDLGSHDLRSVDAVESVLRGAGFEILHLSSEDPSVVYEDEEQWWQRRMGTPRINESTLTPEARTKLKTATFEMLQQFKQADGVHETRNTVFAVARKPA